MAFSYREVPAMSRQTHVTTPRGTRRTIFLIAMLAAALLAPKCGSSKPTQGAAYWHAPN